MKKQLRDRTVDLDYLLAGKQIQDEEQPKGKENNLLTIEETEAPKIVNSAKTEIKKKINKNVIAADDKVKFMTYLRPELHNNFSLMYIDVRAEARQQTRKQLSQSEMIEVLIEYARKKSGGNFTELAKIAEKLINDR